MCAEQIRIGRGVVISYNTTIADSDFHPRDPDLRRLDAIANAPGGDRATRPAVVTRPVIIEDGVWIGIGAIVLKGVRIGRNARVGAGAVVVRDVAPEAFVLATRHGRQRTEEATHEPGRAACARVVPPTVSRQPVDGRTELVLQLVCLFALPEPALVRGADRP